ncbi:hypothetical protein LCGC14_1356620, partial [marine sediment metagenome]
MLVVVDRKLRVVRVSGLTVQEAGWLGYKFTKEYPSLVKDGKEHGWYVIAFDSMPDRYDRTETYNIEASWNTASYKIPRIIENPPPAPTPPV